MYGNSDVGHLVGMLYSNKKNKLRKPHAVLNASVQTNKTCHCPNNNLYHFVCYQLLSLCMYACSLFVGLMVVSRIIIKQKYERY